MPIVVDTSVPIAVIAAEAERASLIRGTQGAELIAPTPSIGRSATRVPR